MLGHVLITFVVLLLPAVFAAAQKVDRSRKRPNILFVIVDDLRPSLGCYHNEGSSDQQLYATPNIDRFASEGMLFENAFAQQALCGPSRISMLTSRRPDSLRTFDNEHTYWRKYVGNFTTLPQHFKTHGYETISVGKVFHPGKLSGGSDDYPFSWSRKPFHPKSEKYERSKVCRNPDGSLSENLLCAVNVSQQPLQTLPDIETTAYAIDVIRLLATESRQAATMPKPFFLAVGFHKPHIPLRFPQEFLEFYPIRNISLAPNPKKPKQLPAIAWNPWADIRERDDVKQLNASFPYGPLPKLFQIDYFKRRVRQNYFAAVSYIDKLFGELLNALEVGTKCEIPEDNVVKIIFKFLVTSRVRLAWLSRFRELNFQMEGFRNDTIVILTSDHGWSLGEHAEWAKYSNFGVATRVPLILRIPGKTGVVAARRRSDAFVELVDLLPTLSELAGIAVPPRCPRTPNGSITEKSVNLCTEGSSFAKLLMGTAAATKKRDCKRCIFTQYPRPSLVPQLNSDQPRWKEIKFMGFAIRTKQFHYTEWIRFDPKTNTKFWNETFARELYDLSTDALESHNVANRARFAGAVRRMSQKLRRGWRSYN